MTRLATLLADLSALANELETALEGAGISTGPARQLRAVRVGIEHAVAKKEKRREEEEARVASTPPPPSAEDVWESCGKKKRYHSLEMAGRAAESAKAKGSTDDLRIYGCELCGGWHLSHVPLERLAR